MYSKMTLVLSHTGALSVLFTVNNQLRIYFTIRILVNNLMNENCFSGFSTLNTIGDLAEHEKFVP